MSAYFCFHLEINMHSDQGTKRCMCNQEEKKVGQCRTEKKNGLVIITTESDLLLRARAHTQITDK
jgi:hypothetical protein